MKAIGLLPLKMHGQTSTSSQDWVKDQDPSTWNNLKAGKNHNFKTLDTRQWRDVKWLKWYYDYSNFCLDRVFRSRCAKRNSMQSLALSLGWGDRSGSLRRTRQLKLLQGIVPERRELHREMTLELCRGILLNLQQKKPPEKIIGNNPWSWHTAGNSSFSRQSQ